eukprot:TRINITY_DN9001_c0_g1_i1.p1 TRINITY_DN9001_c0_g1~~TRINITY_DN9001_c0_g1_i1.p1  ORF type:complete len:1149 (-),score=269.74 TRINITY_DN9001_c0_g1_i1:247-3693(-)
MADVDRNDSNDTMLDTDTAADNYMRPRAAAKDWVAQSQLERANKASEGVKLGMMGGVFIPVCENMWGVLIFLRFYFIVGNAGVWEAWGAVVLSFTVALFTTLSVSAIASNSTPRKGGVYALMSNAMGHSVAGAVGLVYFLALCFLACLEMVGAIEALVTIYPGLGFGGHTQVLGSIVCITLAVTVLVGVKFVSRLGLVFAFVVFYSIFSMYAGLFAAPVQGRATNVITGLSSDTLSDNLGTDYSNGQSFKTILGIFYPCFTGIMAGANRSENLQDHQKAIPQGTLAAITLSLVMYLSLMLMWGAVADRRYLKGDLCGSGASRRLMGGGGGCEVLADVGWPDATVLQWGVVIASISQAMQCMINAPRIFQAVAADGIIPPLRWFGKIHDDEPKRAMLPVYIVSGCGVLAGEIEVIAPIVSMCFLTCYATINLSCFVMALTQAPSWRPSWKYFHPATALIGFILAVICMFLISSWWALIVITLTVGILLYIQYKGVVNGFGSGLTGLIAQWAMFILSRVEKRSLEAEVNWRPQILCLYKFHEDTDETHGYQHDDVLYLAHQLKKARGLCIVTAIETGKLTPEKHRLAEREKSVIEAHMRTIGLKGFVHCLISSSYHQGFSHSMQIAGLGPLSPNTIVLAWPRHTHKTNWQSYPKKAGEFVSLIAEATAMEKAVIVMKGSDHFPEPTDVQSGYIDVWWIIHDGGLLLLIAHLLQKHRVWRACKLRVHMVATEADDAALLAEQLQQWLVAIRMEADIDVIKCGVSVIQPYAANYTLRREEREELLRDLQRRTGTEISVQQVEPDVMVANPHRESKPNVFDPEFFKPPSKNASERAGRVSMPNMRVSQTRPTERRFSEMAPPTNTTTTTANDKPKRNNVSVELGEDPPLEGFSLDSGSAAGTGTGTGDAAAAAERSSSDAELSESGSLPMERMSSPTGGSSYDEWHRGKEVVAAIQAGRAVISPNGEVLMSPRTKSRFEVHDIEPLEEDIESPLSTPATSPRCSPTVKPATPKVKNSPTPLGQVGKGRSFSVEERYQQFHTLNQKIRYNMDSYLKAPKLVIINLPDPLAETDPVEYMQYVQILTEDVPRVLLLHGSGHEIISDFNTAQVSEEYDDEDLPEPPKDERVDEDNVHVDFGVEAGTGLKQRHTERQL